MPFGSNTFLFMWKGAQLGGGHSKQFNAFGGEENVLNKKNSPSPPVIS